MATKTGIRKWMAAVLFGMVIPAVGQSSQPATSAVESQPPALEVSLAPHATTGSIDRLDIRMRIEKPNLVAGKTLLRMPLTIVSTPTAAEFEISYSLASRPCLPGIGCEMPQSEDADCKP